MTTIPVKIQITYSNTETQRLGVKEGDVFDAENETFNGKPKLQCWFKAKNGKSCIAYNCQHDEDELIKVTTCKILK